MRRKTETNPTVAVGGGIEPKGWCLSVRMTQTRTGKIVYARQTAAGNIRGTVFSITDTRDTEKQAAKSQKTVAFTQVSQKPVRQAGQR